jgi:hypothetical protein
MTTIKTHLKTHYIFWLSSVLIASIILTSASAYAHNLVATVIFYIAFMACTVLVISPTSKCGFYAHTDKRRVYIDNMG